MGQPGFFDHDKCLAALSDKGEGVDHSRYLMRLAEMEMIDRERRW